MEIGDWPATEGLNDVMRQARSLGLERNLLELEAFGLTIVEPYKAAPREFYERMRDAVFRLIAEESADAVDINLQNAETRPAGGRQLFHLAAKDRVFVESLMNPYSSVFGRYMLGATRRLYSTVAFYKNGEVGTTLLHNDSTGMPGPLPAYGNVCNISWVLTDYTRENGTFYMVPGSHRFCRHPSAVDQPQMMGGPAADDFGMAVEAPAGSLIVFHGNTWHGTVPKTSAGERAHVALAFCRNYVNPAEDYSDMPDETVEEFGSELAWLVGREAWQGYRSEGPQLPRMAKVRGAGTNQYY